MNKIPAGYKKTEVGIIPDDWSVENLKNLTSRIGDGIHSTPKFCENGNYFFVNGNNLANGKIVVTENTQKVSKEEFLLHKRELNDSTVLLSINGTIGNVAFYNLENVVLGKSAAYINLNEKINRHFFFHMIQTHFIKTYFENELTGSTIKNLGLGTIRNTPIPLPQSYAEQTAIATALNDADALITQLEKLIAKKRLIKQGAMQQLLKPQPGWQTKKLGEICKIRRGASPRPIKDPKWFSSNGGRGWIRISDVTSSKMYLYSTTQYLSDEGAKNSVPVNNGDLIMSICATIGVPVIVRIPACIHDGFVVFRDYENSLDSYFLYFFLTERTELLASKGQPGTQKNLNTSIVNDLEISYPCSLNEQKVITQLLCEIDSEIGALEAKLDKFKQIKQGMMQALLTGKVRLL